MSGPIPIALTVLGFALILLGLAIIILYMIQVRFAYPFNHPEFSKQNVGNSWRWFYYGAIQGATPEGPILREKTRQSYLKYYLEDLTKYVDQTFTLVANPLQRLEQDVRQLFVLLEVERHHHRFVLQLSRLFLWGVGIAVVAFVIYLVASFIW